MAEKNTITKTPIGLQSSNTLLESPHEPDHTLHPKTVYTSFKDAISWNTSDVWSNFWSQCRIVNCHHRWPLPVSDEPEEDNLIRIKFLIDWTKVEDWDEDIANEKLDHSITEVQFFETAKNSECFRSLQDVFPELTDEVIEGYTFDHHEVMFQKERDFAEYLEYKENGNLRVETIDETKPISWNSIRDASTEELFQTKLEIFESPPVQETDKKEYRANIRKAESIIEAMYWYYLIVSKQEDSTSKSIHIDDYLNPLEDEALFKLKLQIFEREEVQNSENKEARSKIRKANTLIEMLVAYNELIKE